MIAIVQTETNDLLRIGEGREKLHLARLIGDGVGAITGPERGVKTGRAAFEQLANAPGQT